MKRKYVLVVLMLILSLSLISCNKNVVSNENKAISHVGEDYFKDDNVVAFILNDLNKEKVDIYKKNISIEEYGDSPYESALIIPKYNNMKISVYRADYKDDKIIKNELMYETKNKENYGFLLRHERPEGMTLIIVIEGDNISEEYYYSYNGKDGTPEYEYIRQNKDNTK